jgi:hypothetical protein
VTNISGLTEHKLNWHFFNRQSDVGGSGGGDDDNNNITYYY